MNLKDHGYLEGDNDKLITVQHLPDIQSVSMATSDGDVLLLNTADKEVIASQGKFS